MRHCTCVGGRVTEARQWALQQRRHVAAVESQHAAILVQCPHRDHHARAVAVLHPTRAHTQSRALFAKDARIATLRTW
jgi:hypothetical protein